VAKYEAERVEYWENSALDGRIYEVTPAAPATPPDADGDDRGGCSTSGARGDSNGLRRVAAASATSAPHSMIPEVWGAAFGSYLNLGARVTTSSIAVRPACPQVTPLLPAAGPCAGPNAPAAPLGGAKCASGPTGRAQMRQRPRRHREPGCDHPGNTWQSPTYGPAIPRSWVGNGGTGGTAERRNGGTAGTGERGKQAGLVMDGHLPDLI